MIEIHQVTKSYNTFVALKDINVILPSNSITAVLGLNGAGKTTLLKAIAGVHYVDSGSIRVNGIDVEKYPIQNKRQIGFVAEQDIFYPEFTVYDFLHRSVDILFPKSTLIERKEKVDSVITTCSIQDVIFKKIKTLSKGYKQRLSFANALLHEPKVLLLDEPTSGLDPKQILEMRTLIKNLSVQKTILISTHLMQEVEALCTQILILDKGKIKASGSEKDICNKTNTTCLEKAFMKITQEATQNEK